MKSSAQMRSSTSAPLAHDAATNAAERRSATIEDAAVQASEQPWIGMECFQLSRGKRLAQMDSLDLGGMHVVRERQYAAVQKLGTTPENLCTISYCTPDPAFRFSEQSLASAAPIFFMPGSTQFDLYVPEGAQTGYVSFSEAEFIDCARVLSPEMWDRPKRQVVQFRSARHNALPQVLDLWLSAARSAARSGKSLNTAAMRSIILQTTLQIMTDSAQDDISPPPASLSRAVRICRIARAHVQERFEAQMVPTIVDVCLSVGVSERALQYAFQTCVGVSPLAYIRRCRLNRVRSTLLTADAKVTTVTQVAMQFGFLHLGRFAGEYKQIFEELPTATLARRA
jgi:AraC family ethanolamine operon transcriptional activator